MRDLQKLWWHVRRWEIISVTRRRNIFLVVAPRGTTALWFGHLAFVVSRVGCGLGSDSLAKVQQWLKNLIVELGNLYCRQCFIPSLTYQFLKRGSRETYILPGRSRFVASERSCYSAGRDRLPSVLGWIGVAEERCTVCPITSTSNVSKQWLGLPFGNYLCKMI